MKKRWLAIAGALLAALIIGLVVFMRLRGDEVQAIRLDRQDVVATLTVTGEVEADMAVNFSPKVSARITRIYVDEGERVTPGQLLFELDREEVRARLAEARARAAQTQATLSELREGTRVEQIELQEHRLQESRQRVQQVRASIELAQARLEEAARDTRRMRQLVQQGFATTQEAEQAETAYLVTQRELARLQAELAASQTQVQQAQTQLTEARRGPRQTAIEEAAAARRAAEAAISQVEATLADYRVTSNVGGIVVKRLQDPGELARPGEPVLRVINPATLEIVTAVEENDLAKIKVGDQAIVVMDAMPETPLEAVVTEIGSQVDPEQGTVEVSVELRQQAYQKLGRVNLLPGMTADVNIVTERLQNALVVPAAAIRRQGGQSLVYVIENNRVRPRPVEVRRISMENYQVLSGVKAGEWVVASFTPKVLEMRRVTPIPYRVGAEDIPRPGGMP